MIDYFLFAVLLISAGLDSWILSKIRDKNKEQAKLNKIIINRSKDIRERDMFTNQRIDDEIDRIHKLSTELQFENARLNDTINDIHQRLVDMEIIVQNLKNQPNNV